MDELQATLLDIYHDRLPLPELERWIYSNRQLELLLPEEEYLRLIGLDYRNSINIDQAKQILIRLMDPFPQINDEISIITDLSRLEGSCYIEVLAGDYKGQCWNQGSLYFREEVFGYFERIISQYQPDYDHYSFTSINKTQCLRIIEHLRWLEKTLAEAASLDDITAHIGFFFSDTDKCFESRFEDNKRALQQVTRQFCCWIETQLNHHQQITILGI